MTHPVCPCVRDHVPNAKVLHKHHIIPKSWGGTDHEPGVWTADDGTETNLVHLCPTSHENIHRLLNEYVRHLAEPGWDVRQRYTTMERWMAKTAWDWWVAQHGVVKPPWTMGLNQADDIVEID